MAIEAEKLTGDNIYKVLIYFEDVYKRQSLKNIQAILASGQDKAIPEQSTATASSSQYGFTLSLIHI